MTSMQSEPFKHLIDRIDLLGDRLPKVVQSLKKEINHFFDLIQTQ